MIQTTSRLTCWLKGFIFRTHMKSSLPFLSSDSLFPCVLHEDMLTSLLCTLLPKLINNFRHGVSIFILSLLFQERKLTNLCGCTQSSWRKAALIDCWHIWMKLSEPKGAEGKSRVSLLLEQCSCLCQYAALYAAFKRLKYRWQSHLCRIKTMHSDLKIPIKVHVNTWEEPEEKWRM